MLCINTINLRWSMNLQAWDRNHLNSMELIFELLPKTHDLQLKSNQDTAYWNNNNLNFSRGIQQNLPHATHNVLENPSLLHIQRNRKMWPSSWAGLGKNFPINGQVISILGFISYLGSLEHTFYFLFPFLPLLPNSSSSFYKSFTSENTSRGHKLWAQGVCQPPE